MRGPSRFRGNMVATMNHVEHETVDVEVQVRQLKGKDLRWFANLLGKLSQDGKNELRALMKALEQRNRERAQPEDGALAVVPGDDEPAQDGLFAVGFDAFAVLLKYLPDEVYEWAADLGNISVEQLDELPLGTPLQILNTVVQENDLTDFFALARQLMASLSGAFSTSSKPATAGQTKK